MRARLAARHTRAQRPGLTHNDGAGVKSNARDDDAPPVDETVLRVGDVQARDLLILKRLCPSKHRMVFIGSNKPSEPALPISSM